MFTKSSSFHIRQKTPLIGLATFYGSLKDLATLSVAVTAEPIGSMPEFSSPGILLFNLDRGPQFPGSAVHR